MKRKTKATINNNIEQKRRTQVANRAKSQSTQVGDVRDSTGVAIGTNAKATVIQVGSLFDFSNLRTLVRSHWFFLAINILCQFSAISLWTYYKDRFLIPQWTLLVGMLLLETSLVSFYLLILHPARRSFSLLFGTISLLSLAGLTIFEYDRVIHPPRFDRDDFGVAIAYFGEGPDFENSLLARQVSETVLERLETDKQARTGLGFVQFKQIGLVRTGEEAVEDGKRIDADLVIWGQLLQTEDRTSIKYTVLESDQIPAPTYQRIIPLLSRSISDTIFIPSKESRELAAATATISGFTFGMAHLSKWEFSLAEEAFQEAVTAAQASQMEAENNLYALYFYHGISQQWPGKLLDANKQFDLAIAENEADPAGWLGIAYSHRSLGNLKDAELYALEAYRKTESYLLQHNDDPYAYYDRALANIILQDWESALADYEKAISLQPDLYIAYIGRIRMNLELNRLDQAIQASEEAIQLAESNSISSEWAYLYLADSHSREGNIEQARLAFEKATILGSHIDWIRYQAGDFYERAGDFNSAESEYQAMLKVTSNPAWAHATLGNFYLKLDLTVDALSHYEEANRLNPEDDGIWIGLAYAHEIAGNAKQAEYAYNEALNRVNKTSNEIYDRFRYGNFLFGQGRYEEAVFQWESALALDTQRCDLMMNIGLGYEELGDSASARTVYSNALSLDATSNPDCMTDDQSDDVQFRLDTLPP